MNQEEIKKAIFERYNNLQPEIQEAIMDPEYENKLIKIAKDNNLTEEQIKELELNTTLVLLGQTHPNSYKNELIEDLKISEGEASKITLRVNEEILKNIKDILINNYDTEEEAERKLEESSNPITQPSPKSTYFENPKFKTLSIEEQDGINKSDYQTKSYVIGQKYNLSIEKLGVLEEIVKDTLLGTIYSHELPGELKSKLDLSVEQVSNIIEDLNEEIFRGARDTIIYKDKKENNMDSNKVVLPPENNDPVPLPPYKKKEEVRDTEKIIEEERNFNTKNGSNVEFMEEEKKDNRELQLDEEKENKTLANSGIDLIGDKLSKPSVSNSTISDHSIGALKNSNGGLVDIYREEV